MCRVAQPSVCRPRFTYASARSARPRELAERAAFARMRQRTRPSTSAGEGTVGLAMYHLLATRRSTALPTGCGPEARARFATASSAAPSLSGATRRSASRASAAFV